MTDKLSENELSQLSDFIAANMGLYFPQARWTDLERQTILAAKDFGFATASPFLQWLFASPLTQEQIEILAGHLTIAETYFWREPHLFEALREQILPGLIQARESGNRRLRIWCAACATGEEPYSIAIVLRSLIPDLATWHITLLATDINPKILRQAAAGEYREWSFRNVPAGFREKHFIRTQEGTYKILPEIRRMVTFAYLNLAVDIYPSPMNNTNAMDLIFCRNVLMYFAPELTVKVGHHLHDALIEGGWLIVSSSELSQINFSTFVSVSFPGAIVYRRQAATVKTPPALRLTPASIPFSRLPPPPITTTVAPSVAPVPQPAPTDTEKGDGVAPQPILDAALDAILAVRTLANQGKLDAALARCQTALATDKLNLGLHFLSATILQEQDRGTEAMATLRGTLFLDPTFVMGHFAVGNLAHRQGNQVAALKSFRNALDLLEKYDADDLPPEAEGLTAGRLREIIRATMQTGEPIP